MTITILGIFAGDTVYRADRLPRTGETFLGQDFQLGPGGKGSNQAIAAARAGGNVRIITRLGADAFADIARTVWSEAGVTPDVTLDKDSHTGAAFLFVGPDGQNAIIVVPGAAGRISIEDIESRADVIARSRVFLTQLEQPLPPALRALEYARTGGAITVLNPAPATMLPEGMLALCDLVTPNETEAEILTGITVTDPASAEAAARVLRAQGAEAVIVTLGAQGALYHNAHTTLHVPPVRLGQVVDTTGAGDAFNGGLVAAIADGQSMQQALRFATVTASLSVMKAGAAKSMPLRREIEDVLSGV